MLVLLLPSRVKGVGALPGVGIGGDGGEEEPPHEHVHVAVAPVGVAPRGQKLREDGAERGL